MIKDRTIICVASSWDNHPTSKHHVMKLLAKHNRVIWVSYHGTRRPTLSYCDVRASVATLAQVLRGVRPAEDSMVHFTPLVIPGANYGILRRINQWALVAQIRRVLRRLRTPRNEPVQLWTFTPDVDFLAGKFDEERVVYYCVDEYAQFEGFDGQAIRDAELRLFDQADVVITSSQALYDSKSPLHPDVHLIRHGVDVNHFASALHPNIETPPELAGLKGPIVGFFGLLHHWIDIDLIADAAQKASDMQFVLIGDVFVDTSRLHGLPNVHLLGGRPYAELPKYCAAFDVAILPFKINEMTPYINPIKLREYLAAGLPVVSTPMPEAKVFEPDVRIAPDAAAFASACRVAAHHASREDRLRRSQLVAGDTWEATVDQLCAIVAREQIATTHERTIPSPANTTRVTTGMQESGRLEPATVGASS
jgi:glycosyltransferase involved in cell wall biosynthesis